MQILRSHPHLRTTTTRFEAVEIEPSTVRKCRLTRCIRLYHHSYVFRFKRVIMLTAVTPLLVLYACLHTMR